MSADVVKGVGLRVPTEAGWHPAVDAIFSPGWSEEHEEHDRLVRRFVDAAESAAPSVAQFAGRLLVEPDALAEAQGAVENFGCFSKLPESSVGSNPFGIQPRTSSLNGESVNAPVWPRIHTLCGRAGTEGLAGVVRSLAEALSSVSNVAYHPDGSIVALPAQFEFDALDETARTLLRRTCRAWPRHLARPSTDLQLDTSYGQARCAVAIARGYSCPRPSGFRRAPPVTGAASLTSPRATLGGSLNRTPLTMCLLNQHRTGGLSMLVF